MIQRRALKTLLTYTPDARRFLSVIFALGFVIDGIYTVLLNLYLLRLGYGTEFIGLMNAAGLFSFSMMGLPAGLMGARWSNTRLLKIGVGFVLPATILLPLVEFVPASLQDAWLLMLYPVMLGGFSMYFVNGEPFLMNSVDASRRNDAFAHKTALLAMAAFIGSLVGGILPEVIADVRNLSLDDPVPYRMTLMSCALLMTIAFGFVLKLQGDPESSEDENDEGAANPVLKATTPAKVKWTLPVIGLIVVMAIVRLGQVATPAAAIVYFNVYMDTELAISTGVIGIIAAIGRLSGVGTALLIPRILKRYSKSQVIMLAAMGAAFCMLPLALIHNPIAAALGFIGVQAMTSIRYTAFVIYTMELVPKVQQSVMAGIGEMAGGGSFAMMSLIGGFIIARSGFQDLFLLAAGITLLGTGVFWWHTRQIKTKAKRKIASTG